jgi:hypothetical protein
MAVYLVSYDLRAPGRNYAPLWDRLRQYTYAKGVESGWLVDTTWSAAQVRDDLTQHVDANDLLLVVRLAGESAWTKLLPGADQFLRDRFGAG